jgi:TRAP-type C4-dicarboxylate transport system permease small subunit
MKAILHKINQILSAFCGWLMLAMMIFLVIDIFSRTIAKPIQGMTELTVFVMMVAIYLGLARCEENKEHVQLEIVVNFLPASRKKFIEFFVYLLALATVSILLYALTKNTITSFQSGEALPGTVEFRIWPVKFIMLIGLVFYWIQTLMNALDTANQLRNVKK